jgi:hypothetical protein
MSFRGGRGGGGRGGGGFSSRGGTLLLFLQLSYILISLGRGGFQSFNNGPPAQIVEMGTFLHPCEGEIVCESINTKIPHFNAPIFLENKVRSRLYFAPLILTLNRHQLVKLTKFSAQSIKSISQSSLRKVS